MKAEKYLKSVFSIDKKLPNAFLMSQISLSMKIFSNRYFKEFIKNYILLHLCLMRAKISE